jgi:hypothetical protein
VYTQIKVNAKLSLRYDMKTHGGGGRSGLIAPSFLISALDGGEWSASGSSYLTPGERATGTHWIGGWVGPTAGVDVEKRKIFPLMGFEHWPSRPLPVAVPAEL